MEHRILAIAIVLAGLFGAAKLSAQMPEYPSPDPEALKQFADRNVGRRAIKAGDRNGDGFLSKEEADSLTVLNLTAYRIDPFDVVSYADLAKFPNLREVYLGESDLEEVDLSKNPKLEIIGIHSLSLKVLVIGVGSMPKILFPPRAGEVTIRRVINKNDPNSIWYE